MHKHQCPVEKSFSDSQVSSKDAKKQNDEATQRCAAAFWGFEKQYGGQGMEMLGMRIAMVGSRKRKVVVSYIIALPCCSAIKNG
jgi:hypothetical protein